LLWDKGTSESLLERPLMAEEKATRKESIDSMRVV